jgi:adenine-specific DNA-methyltransferase
MASKPFDEAFEKVRNESVDVAAQSIAELGGLFPAAFTEGKIDFAKLRQLLGDDLAEGPERFGLSWSGKSDAIKAIQTSTTATLLPARDESVNFDATENLIIEGDNLEVLKLLQGGYHGRVKMIYIDPPYNTGGEFIYPDNYKEGLADYLKFSGQVSGEGIKLTTNAETDGRYHSKWLTMMYPRLFLARNLLREDGVIFVSIDDHEVHNLRAAMNEIFGEENFIVQLVWHSKKGGGGDVKTIVGEHEYILAYARQSRDGVVSKQQLDAAPLDLVDEKGAYRKGRELNKWGAGSSRADRPTMFFPIPGPNDEDVFPIRNDGSEGRWRFGKERMLRFVADKDALFERRPEGTFIVYEKVRTDLPRLKAYRSLLSDIGTTADGTAVLKELFDSKSPFDFSKPVALVSRLIEITGLDEDDLVLDFFAGSGTTAQAVLELNAEDGGNRKFVLVQLPEPTERKDFATIADITKERVRRVIKKLNEADDGKLPVENKPDRGFKVYKLSSSNFKVWDAATAPKDAAGLAEQLKLIANNVEEGRPEDALLYELILRSNLPLTSKVAAGQIGEQAFYDVAEGTLAICLERKITQATLRGMMARKPKGVICLDVAFTRNDQLKTNTVLEMRSHGVEFRTA